MIKIIKEESSSKFVIMGVTDTGSKVYYNAEKDHLTTDMLDATVYSERDIAVDDWNMLTNYGKKLPSGIRRLFIPLYNPEIMTESKESYLDKFRSMITDDGTLDRMVKIGNKLKIDTSKDPSESDAKKLINAYYKEYGRKTYKESKSTKGGLTNNDLRNDLSDSYDKALSYAQQIIKEYPNKIFAVCIGARDKKGQFTVGVEGPLFVADSIEEYQEKVNSYSSGSPSEYVFYSVYNR